MSHFKQIADNSRQLDFILNKFLPFLIITLLVWLMLAIVCAWREAYPSDLRIEKHKRKFTHVVIVIDRSQTMGGSFPAVQRMLNTNILPSCGIGDVVLGKIIGYDAASASVVFGLSEGDERIRLSSTRRQEYSQILSSNIRRTTYSMSLYKMVRELEVLQQPAEFSHTEWERQIQTLTLASPRERVSNICAALNTAEENLRALSDQTLEKRLYVVSDFRQDPPDASECATTNRKTFDGAQVTFIYPYQSERDQQRVEAFAHQNLSLVSVQIQRLDTANQSTVPLLPPNPLAEFQQWQHLDLFRTCLGGCLFFWR